MSFHHRSLILVLGMHRSGTSLLTHLLHALGMELGDRLVPPGQDNPKGFFEHNDIVELNESIFRLFQLSSQDTIPFPDGWLEHPEMTSIKDKLSHIILSLAETSSCVGIKDPRIAKLLPLWLPLLDSLKITPKIVMALRHPLEVAKSMEERDTISIERALALWLDYNLAIIQHTHHLSRIIIPYDQLISDTEKLLHDIIIHSEVNFPIPLDNIARTIEGIIDPNLKHHHHDNPQQALVPEMVMWCYESLIRGEFSNDNAAGLASFIAMIRSPLLESIRTQHNGLYEWRNDRELLMIRNRYLENRIRELDFASNKRQGKLSGLKSFFKLS